MLRLFKKRLPDCNTLFKKFFSPWFDENDIHKMPWPDMFQIAAWQGQPLNLEEVQYLADDYLITVKQAVEEDMTKAALADFGKITKSNKFDLHFLAAVDKYYDRAKINELIKESDPADFCNNYLVTVCEFGAMLGSLFLEQGGFGWIYSHPYFNSIIVHKNTGYGIPVFDWAVKKFSEYGVDDGYVGKFNAALNGISKGFEEE